MADQIPVARKGRMKPLATARCGRENLQEKWQGNHETMAGGGTWKSSSTRERKPVMNLSIEEP
jgi:hypothetical protein